MFEFPYNEYANSYIINISYDLLLNDTAKQFTLVKKTTMPVVRIGNLPLGKKYKWHIETELKSGEKIISENHFFSILNTEFADKNKYIIKQNYNQKDKILDGLIWCDQFHCALDRLGNIVWFLPTSIPDFEEKRQIRDFKLYDDRSITFISVSEAYHTDINTNIIWKGPNNGKVSAKPTEDYHHEFVRKKNGNYLVLGTEKVEIKTDKEKDTSKTASGEFSNLIEYDPSGKVVWAWKMKDDFPYEYLINSTIKTKNGFISPHANAFFYDEKTNSIYISFRDISRIIQIDKKSKKIIASYGIRLNPKEKITETSIFKFQHNVQAINSKELLIFNNNDIKGGAISSVDILELPQKKQDSLKIKWTFKLDFDKINNGKALKMGGMKILPNKNLLINEGTLSRIVETNENKDILWDLTIDHIDSTGKKDPEFCIYRANYSSSLYPYYFVVATDIKKQIHIFNSGDEGDCFEIKFFNQSMKLIGKLITKKIPGNNYETIATPAKLNKPFIVEITSLKTKETKVLDFK